MRSIHPSGRGKDKVVASGMFDIHTMCNALSAKRAARIIHSFQPMQGLAIEALRGTVWPEAPAPALQASGLASVAPRARHEGMMQGRKR